MAKLNCIETLPSLLFSALLYNQWYSIFHKCNLVNITSNKIWIYIFLSRQGKETNDNEVIVHFFDLKWNVTL
jgi:hypothetical protein